MSLSGLAARTALSTALLFLVAGVPIGQGGFGLVDILHGCLTSDTRYDEATAWSHHAESVAA